MKTLLVATRNRGKLNEISQMLLGVVGTVLCLEDIPDFPEICEDGKTFAENALKKAREASAATGLPAIGDDSGLVVEALGGQPGVYSARFAGEHATDEDNNRRLLNVMNGIPSEQRSGAFVCVLAYVTPQGEEQLFTGRIDGTILDAPQGSGGFGYDPLFLVEAFGRTMAELTLDEKNRISHRGQAVMGFKAYLTELCCSSREAIDEIII